ncbi:MAG: transposase, partial [Gammaproteobacteria bacterium]
MRGTDVMQEPLFTTVQLETFVPKDHPVRALRVLMDEALNELNELFDAIYADGGRESIPPERLLRAQLLQVLYSIRSERQLCEQLQYNLLFRWFVGLPIEAATGSGTAPVDAFGHLLAWTDGNNVSTVMGYDQATGAPVGISTGIGQSSAVQSL